MSISFWIDTESGTYGRTENIKFITFSNEQEDLIEAFTEGSDNYRIQAAKAWGEDFT